MTSLFRAIGIALAVVALSAGVPKPSKTGHHHTPPKPGKTTHHRRHHHTPTPKTPTHGRHHRHHPAAPTAKGHHHRRHHGAATAPTHGCKSVRLHGQWVQRCNFAG